jgi:general secretion pathway protein J
VTQRKNGFTLVEVLIAVAIFAIMSAFAYRALGSILNTRERVEQENQKWRDVSTFFARLEADFSNGVARSIRNSSNQAQGFIGNSTLTNDSDGQVMFTRMGMPGATGALAAPQRLGFRIKQGVLEELVWPVLDQGPRTVPAIYPLLTGATTLTMRYLDENYAWQSSWPPLTNGPPPTDKIPKAIEVALTLDSGETITRLLLLNS